MIRVEGVARSEILSTMEWGSECDLARVMRELTLDLGQLPLELVWIPLHLRQFPLELHSIAK